MDNLTQRLDQILNDPGSIKQIMELASAFGASPSENSSAENAELPPELSNMLEYVQKKEHKQQALVQALLPYLNPGRQARLERAMQIARLSQLAGAAMQGNHISAKQEETNV